MTSQICRITTHHQENIIARSKRETYAPADLFGLDRRDVVDSFL